MSAAAVERGTDATRLVVPGPDGRPEPVAVLPAGTPVETALELLVGPSPGPVAVVEPPDEPSSAVGPTPVVGVPLPGGSTSAGEGPAVGAVPGRVVPASVSDQCTAPSPVPGRRSVPAPVAVLAGRSGRFLVVDAGRSGTTLTVVDDGCVRSTVRVPVGGDRLDAVLAAATGCPADLVRRARETLSTEDRVDVPGFGPLDAAVVDALLRPELDEIVTGVRSTADGVDEIVVAGGLARAPLLAEMLDERVDRPVRVLPEPDLAAVRGALELLRTGDGPAGVVAEPPSDVAGTGDTAATAADAGPARAASRRAGGLGPAGPRRSRNGRLLPVAVVLGVLLVGTGTALGATAEPAPPPSQTLVQYGYVIALPAGWEHTGGDPERRRTLLTRTAAPDGVELISVERSPLGYDTAAEPDRARDELVAAHRAEGDLGDLRPDSVAGRAVTRYRQQAGSAAVVDWYVLFDGTDELVVGCRRSERGPAPEQARACTDVVESVRTVDVPG